MKSVVEWILYIGFALLVFYVVRNGIPFIDLQDLPDAILNSVSTHEQAESIPAKTMVGSEIILDSVSTHEEAELIPAKTMAGSEICNDGIDVKILCVEILEYKGFRNSGRNNGKDLIIEGLEAAIRKYPLTEKELTVDWVGFGSEGGSINYLGVVLYNPKESVMEDIAEDLCQYTRVVPEYRAFCVQSRLSLFEKINPKEFVKGGYIQITDIDNGHTILVKDSTFFTFDWEREVREIVAHEYFHMYQKVHDKHNTSPILHLTTVGNKYAFPSKGAYWFIEGSAEYSRLVTGNDNGWSNMKDQLQSAINEISYSTQ